MGWCFKAQQGNYSIFFGLFSESGTVLYWRRLCWFLRRHCELWVNFQSWKQKLRENCYKRVREGRSRLLWRMRLPLSSSPFPHSLNNQQQDFIKSAFQDIFSDELEKIKEDPSLNDYSKNSTSITEIEDVLWEYEGIQDAYKGECEERLLEMQMIFYEDLKDSRQKGCSVSSIGSKFEQ